MKKVLVLALLAGGVSQAVAQTGADPIPGSLQVQAMEPGVAPGPGYRKIDGRYVRFDSNPSISNRAVGYVYDNINIAWVRPLSATGAGFGNRIISDDTQFAPGPWATQAVRNLSAFDVGTFNAGPSGVPFDILFEVFDINDHNYLGQGGVNNPAISATSVPLADFIYTGFNPVGVINWFANLDIPGPDIAVPAGDSGVIIRMTAGVYNATTDIFTPNLGAAQSGGWALGSSGPFTVGGTFADYINAAGIGFTDISHGRDVPPAATALYDGIISGNTVINSTVNPGNDRRTTLVVNGPAATPNSWYNLFWGWRGDIIATAPACESFTLGADNTFASDTEALAANGVKWYCVTLASDVIDENNKFIDFDTETSGGDAAIGIYNAEGALIVSNDDSGSGTNAQLSFGLGRRAAQADGVQYDGRNFDDSVGAIRGLAAGTYYVAVAASSNVASFGDGFSVTGNGTAGSVTLRVRTNEAGGALDPSVAPVATRIVGLSLEDPVLAPGGQSASVNLPGRSVNWLDVQICTASSDTQPITISESAASSAGSSVLMIFNSAGNLVAQQAGSTAARASITFSGSPALPVGTYYIAQSYAVNHFSNAPETDGRWHVRPVSLDSGFAFQVAIAVEYNECDSSGPSCDYDFNQDENVDLTDAQQMAQVFVGSLVAEPNWLDGDLNGDENADLTDAQILAAFVVTGVCGL